MAKKGTTRPSGNIAPAPKSSPAPIVKDSKGNVDPRYGKRIQQEQGVQAAQKAAAQKASIKQGNANIANSYQAQANKINADKAKATKKKKKVAKTTEATIPLEEQVIIVGGGGYDSGYSEYTFTPKSIKVPDRDAVIALQRDGADQALITSVLFEQIGATELVKFVKNDTVDGLNPQYNVISNISDLRTKLDTSYLISKQRSDTTIDNGFSIRLQDKLPSIDYLFDNNIPNYVHFDATISQDGSLVIELDNIDIDEIIEVEIDTNGTIVEVRQ